MPPLDLIAHTLLIAVLPAGLTAAVLAAAVTGWGGAKRAPLGAALGLAGGAVLGNWLCGTLPLDAGTSAWNRLPAAALAALAAGLAVRWPGLPPLTGWLVRAATAAAAAWSVVPDEVRLETGWLPVALAVVILAEWAVLEPLAARPPGGGVPLALTLTALVASTVLVHASTGKLAEVATVLAGALVGVGFVAWWRRLDGGAAVPGAVVLLPGLLSMGQQATFSEVPWSAFAAAALAPLMLAVSLVPPLRTWQGARLRWLRGGLLLVPLAVAIWLALQAGPLEFD